MPGDRIAMIWQVRRHTVKSYVVAGLLFFILTPSMSLADERDQIRQEAKNHLQAVLDYSNQKEGIEFVGGPVALTDYDIEYSTYSIECEYKDKRPRVMSLPRNLYMTVLSGLAPLQKKKIAWVLWKEDFEAFHSKAVGRKQRMALFEYLYKATGAGNTKKSILPRVHVSKEGSVQRTTAFLKNRLVDIVQLGDDRIQLIFRDGDSCNGKWYLLTDNTGRRLFDDISGEWNIWPSFEKMLPLETTAPAEQTFFLLGADISDQQLSALVGLARTAPREQTIFAIDITHIPKDSDTNAHNLASVSYGAPAFDYPLLSVVLAKDDNSMRVLRFYYMLPELLSGFKAPWYSGVFSFTRRLTGTELDKLMEKAKVSPYARRDPNDISVEVRDSGKGDARSLLGICGRIDRLRDFRRLEYRISSDGTATVSVGSTMLAFWKKEGKWVLEDMIKWSAVPPF